MPFSSCGFLWIVPQQSDRCTPQVERRQQLLADCPIRQQNPLAGSPNTSACITMSESRRAASSKVRQPPCRLQTGVKPDCVFFKIEHTFNRKKKMRTYFANTVLVFQLNKYTVLFLVSVQSPIFWSHFTLKGPLSGSFSGAYFKFSCLPDNPYRLSCSKDALFFSYCPLSMHLYPPFVWTLWFNSCVFKARLPKSPLCSDWSALKGLNRNRAQSFCISSAIFNFFL